jgi:hypothetical protein
VAEPEGVYAIHYRTATIAFTIGFCEGWVRDGRCAKLDRPFVQAVLFVRGGEILFRGVWQLAPSVRMATHEFSWVPWAAWMGIGYTDLVAAAAALKKCSTGLDPKGFSRL